jgi:hypothetical protein
MALSQSSEPASSVERCHVLMTLYVFGLISLAGEHLCRRPQFRDLNRPPLLLALLCSIIRFAERCFVVSTSFLDSLIASASFALVRRLISRSSPVSAMFNESSFSFFYSDAPMLYMENCELSHQSTFSSVTLARIHADPLVSVRRDHFCSMPDSHGFLQPATQLSSPRRSQ